MLRFIDPMAPAAWPGGVRQADRAIVTLLLGEEYRTIWERVCRPSWEHYADRFGHDICVITAPLDVSPRAAARSPAWQKLLVLDQPWAQRYERILWLDADILISPRALDIFKYAADPTCIGACGGGEQLSDAEKIAYLNWAWNTELHPSCVRQAWQMYQEASHRDHGLAADVPTLGTGVLVLSPVHHARLLRAIYATDGESRLYEQPAFMQAVAEAGRVQYLDPRFNWSVHEYLVVNGCNDPPTTVEAARRVFMGLAEELERVYFLHFAASMILLRMIADLTEV
jgi:hypothetical protein